MNEWMRYDIDLTVDPTSYDVTHCNLVLIEEARWSSG